MIVPLTPRYWIATVERNRCGDTGPLLVTYSPGEASQPARYSMDQTNEESDGSRMANSIPKDKLTTIEEATQDASTQPAIWRKIEWVS